MKMWLIRTPLLLLVLTGCANLVSSTSDTDIVMPTLAVLPTTPPSPTVVSLTPTQMSQSTAIASIPTLIPTSLPSLTSTFTATPFIPTATFTITPSTTVTSSPTPRGISGLELLGELAKRTTVIPRTSSVSTPSPHHNQLFPTSSHDLANVDCNTIPAEIFGKIHTSHASVQIMLGCPVISDASKTQQASAYQNFEFGFMFWISHASKSGTIFAATNDGFYTSYEDTWNASNDLDNTGVSPPPNRIEPRRGFGKVWHQQPSVHDTLGWAIDEESGAQSSIMTYQHGQLIVVPQRQTVIAFGNNSRWWSYPLN